MNADTAAFFCASGGAELSKGDGMEGEYASRLPGHLSPRGAAAQLHWAASGDGQQSGHQGMEETATHRLSRAHTFAAGEDRQRVSWQTLYNQTFSSYNLMFLMVFFIFQAGQLNQSATCNLI